MSRNTVVVVLAVLLCFLENLTNGRSTSKDLIWFPKDDGQGFSPAFINSAERGFVAPAADPDNIHFYLFTLNNPESYDEIFNTTDSLVNSHWDVNAPVKIFAHGFSSSFDGGSGEEIKNGYITNGYPTNINLVLVQWRKLAAAPFYDVAAINTKLVGEKVAYLASFLVENQFTTLSQVHLGGHSLGAHAMGFAGRFYQEMNPGTIIPRITGLDPAFLLFGSVSDRDRIDPTDAEFVDIIHTASGTILDGELSFIEPRGTVDFYPNTGRDQPGCEGLPDLVGACSHSRCYQYFSESIQNDFFRACKCDDNAWDPSGEDNFSSCSCDKGSANMGEWTPNTVQGIYFLVTGSESPFAV